MPKWVSFDATNVDSKFPTSTGIDRIAALLGCITAFTLGGCVNPAMNASLTPEQVVATMNKRNAVIAAYAGSSRDSPVLGFANLDKIVNPLIAACERGGGRPNLTASGQRFSPGGGEVGYSVVANLVTRVKCESIASQGETLWAADLDYDDYKMGNNSYVVGNLTVTVKTKVTYYPPEALAGKVQEAVNKPATSTTSVPAEPVNLTPAQAERIAAQEAKQRAERRRLLTGEDERDERRVREDAEREQRLKVIKAFQEQIKFGDLAAYWVNKNRVRVVEVRLPMVLVQFEDVFLSGTPNKWVDVSLLVPYQ